MDSWIIGFGVEKIDWVSFGVLFVINIKMVFEGKE